MLRDAKCNVRGLLSPLLVMLMMAGCPGPRDYVLTSELPVADPARPKTIIVPGPWAKIPPGKGDLTPPSAVLINALRTLLTLPGATHCESGAPSVLSAEYCIAIYRTPDDWRVSRPVRNLVGEQRACDPPYGGVDDADYGRRTFVVGFAHNHMCNLAPSSKDLSVFPVALIQGSWEAVQFATDIEGRPILVNGQPIPVTSWLITANGRILRWNASGQVEEWHEDEQRWYYAATCEVPTQSIDRYQPPRCVPPLR